MAIVDLLKTKSANAKTRLNVQGQTEFEPLELTHDEYQQLCQEVFAMPLAQARNHDDLILNFLFEGKTIVLIDPTRPVRERH